MSNSIWHTRDEEPKKYPILALGDDGKYYVFESPKLGTGDLGWKHRCHDYVKQYCYIDNLIAQANKAELWKRFADNAKEHIDGLNNMIESWYKLLQSDKDTSTKYAILKSAISAYMENKGDDNE